MLSQHSGSLLPDTLLNLLIFILQHMMAIELEVVPGWPIENAEWENLWLCYNMQTRTGWSGGKPGQLEI